MGGGARAATVVGRAGRDDRAGRVTGRTHVIGSLRIYHPLGRKSQGAEGEGREEKRRGGAFLPALRRLLRVANDAAVSREWNCAGRRHHGPLSRPQRADAQGSLRREGADPSYGTFLRQPPPFPPPPPRAHADIPRLRTPCTDPRVARTPTLHAMMICHACARAVLEATRRRSPPSLTQTVFEILYSLCPHPAADPPADVCCAPCVAGRAVPARRRRGHDYRAQRGRRHSRQGTGQRGTGRVGVRGWGVGVCVCVCRSVGGERGPVKGSRFWWESYAR